jgi:hypothetical protein
VRRSRRPRLLCRPADVKPVERALSIEWDDGRIDERGKATMKAKSKKATPKTPGLDEARLAVTTADAGVRKAKEAARSAKSALKAARKAAKRADKAAKKARKDARRARKQVKALLARQVKLKKQTVARRGSLTKKKAASKQVPSVTEVTAEATSAEILGEHR